MVTHRRYQLCSFEIIYSLIETTNAKLEKFMFD